MDENSKRTILIVEDVKEIQEGMSGMLRARGHEVVTVGDAGEAIKAAEKQRPAMILTDVDLPTLSLLMQEIRGHDGLKDMPVAVIDINGPKINPAYGVSVLADFDQLDALILSLK